MLQRGLWIFPTTSQRGRASQALWTTTAYFHPPRRHHQFFRNSASHGLSIPVLLIRQQIFTYPPDYPPYPVELHQSLSFLVKPRPFPPCREYRCTTAPCR